MIIVLSLVLSIGAPSAQGQPIAYIKSNGSLVIQGQEHPPGFWVFRYPKIKAFEENPEARSLYDEHRRLAAWGSTLFWGGVLASVVYANTAKRVDPGTATYFWAIPVGLSIIPSGLSRKRLLQSINVLNGVSLNQAGAARDRTWGLAYTYSF